MPGLVDSRAKVYGNAMLGSTFPSFTATTAHFETLSKGSTSPGFLCARLIRRYGDLQLLGTGTTQQGRYIRQCMHQHRLKINFEWGVGEDADLITLLPMFNPATSRYIFHDTYWNYPLDMSPDGPPRRTTIITFYRLSKKLLFLMHDENVRPPGHHMSSETWPQSVALHYGLKAVYAPHSIFMDRDWPTEAADFIFNNGDQPRIIQGFPGMPETGEGSGGYESVFSIMREHNFDHSSWYYQGRLAAKLYKRFLGHEVDGIGGKEVRRKRGAPRKR